MNLRRCVSSIFLFFLFSISAFGCGTDARPVPRLDADGFSDRPPSEDGDSRRGPPGTPDNRRDVEDSEVPGDEDSTDEVKETDDEDPPNDTVDGSDTEDVTDEPVPNEGWIGGPCDSAGDCHFENSTCLREGQGYPGGQCTTSCDRLCPDREGNNSITYCINTDFGPRCVSRCDYDLYPEDGCRDGYVCRVKERYNQPGVQQGACVPENDDENLNDCLDRLDELGVGWQAWDYSTQTPDGNSNLMCTVDDPIYISSTVNGVTYRYFSSEDPFPMPGACDLGIALYHTSEILQQWDIVEVEHLGTFNCRTISGTNVLSQHGHGAAIDFGTFIGEAGTRYSVGEHWEYGTENPTTQKGRMLYNFARQLYEERIFKVVLTPNYNGEHSGHFHVDLSENSYFFESTRGSEYWIGSDRDICSGDHPAPSSFVQSR